MPCTGEAGWLTQNQRLMSEEEEEEEEQEQEQEQEQEEGHEY
jgi:hypothetical protein